MITKALVNDRLTHGQEALILQTEMERLSGTLFDHLMTKGQQNQELKDAQ
jgi:hypothetical protein